MKTFLGTLVLGGSLMIGTLSACAHGNPQDYMQKRLDKMKTELSLTDAQVSQVKNIYQQNQTKLDADRQKMKAAKDDSTARTTARAQMKADMDVVQAQVKGILTADQQAKWTQFQAQHQHGDHNGGKRDNDAKS